MGIKGLKEIIDRVLVTNPNAQRELPLECLKGKRVAVDGGVLLMQCMLSRGAWPDEVEKTKYPDESPNEERFIRNMLIRFNNNVTDFLVAGITPVYVFEGTPPPEKANCQEKKKKERLKIKTRYDELLEQLKNTMPHVRREEDIAEIKKLAKKIFPEGMSAIMKNFLVGLGLPTIQCSEEAERLCVRLCLEGYCSAIYTTDRDALVHGCPLVITKIAGNMVVDGKNVKAMEVLDLREILIGLDMNFDTFVDLCILCECDYNERIPGVGPGTALKLIIEHGSIANIPKSLLANKVRTASKSKKNTITKPEKGAYYAQFIANPKDLLNYKDCKGRFAPIDIALLLTAEENERGILEHLFVDPRYINNEIASMLGNYGLINIINDFMSLTEFHPQIEVKDTDRHITPDIVRNKFKMIKGINYFKLWGC